MRAKGMIALFLVPPARQTLIQTSGVLQCSKRMICCHFVLQNTLLNGR